MNGRRRLGNRQADAFHRARLEHLQDNQRTTAPRPCRSCSSMVRWVRIDGRWRLIDAEAARGGTVVWPSGEVVAYLQGTEPETYSAVVARYRLHTCPRRTKAA